MTRTERGLARRMANRFLAVERRKFPSSSNPNLTYTAVLQMDGKLTCDCRGWITKKPHRARWCKHVAELAAGRRIEFNGEFSYVAALVARQEGETIASDQ